MDDELISTPPSKRSSIDHEPHSASRNKRRCSFKNIVTVDLTSDSPPSIRNLIKVSTKSSITHAIPIAPIFQRRDSSCVIPGTKDASGYTPLTFYMPRGTVSKWWTHELYRGPGGRKVKVEYCDTKERMEIVAKTYLIEPIVGFDMEWWPKAGGIKGNISLIQVGVEDRIALFHIAMFKGKTIEELVSPSLRKLVECPDIIKTGSAVYAADGKRLKRFMHLEPRGFLELGHLHRVVMFANSKPHPVNNAGWALAKQVKEHFGIPMSKGPVRCSNWTKRLTSEQIVYAASDAYAGYMLYRVMELKRVAMDPVPPRPEFAEKFIKVRATASEAVERIPASTAHAIHRPELIQGPSDSLADRLYEALRIRRKWFAKKEDVPAYAIALNSTLSALVEARPTDMTGLARVPCMNAEHRAKYGKEWVRIINAFLIEEDSATKSVPVDHRDEPVRPAFRPPKCITPSPQSSLDAAPTTPPVASDSRAPVLCTVQENETKRAMSALRALRIRLSVQNNLARDFISDECLQQFASTGAKNIYNQANSAEALLFVQVLEKCNIDVESFIQKHAPRLLPSQTLILDPLKCSKLTPLTRRMGLVSNGVEHVPSDPPINLLPSDQSYQASTMRMPTSLQRPMKPFASSKILYNVCDTDESQESMGDNSDDADDIDSDAN